MVSSITKGVTIERKKVTRIRKTIPIATPIAMNIWLKLSLMSVVVPPVSSFTPAGSFRLARRAVAVLEAPWVSAGRMAALTVTCWVPSTRLMAVGAREVLMEATSFKVTPRANGRSLSRSAEIDEGSTCRVTVGPPGPRVPTLFGDRAPETANATI